VPSAITLVVSWFSGSVGFWSSEAWTCLGFWVLVFGLEFSTTGAMSNFIAPFLFIYLKTAFGRSID
jgi:hypothetical protein